MTIQPRSGFKPGRSNPPEMGLVPGLAEQGLIDSLNENISDPRDVQGPIVVSSIFSIHLLLKLVTTTTFYSSWVHGKPLLRPYPNIMISI